MKHINKKEFNRFYTIMKNNPKNTVIENHALYQKELAKATEALEANNLMSKELLTNKIK